MELIFATNNINKIKEIQSLIGDEIKILGLKDINCNEELPENQDTLEGNALEKAKYVYDNYNKNCFADDTGLEIQSLNNRPGVYSARYAGENNDSEANMKKVLTELENISDRKAQFRTVISLIINGKIYNFEGIVKGEITQEKKGKDGFGYDPIFLPEKKNYTFAEMSLDEKNTISHRALATFKLIDFLKKNFKNAF